MLRPSLTVDFDDMVGFQPIDEPAVTSVEPRATPAERPTEPPSPLPDLDPAPSMTLWVEEPDRSPRRVTLPAHHAVRIGRSSQTDVPVADITVSRHHAVVWFDGRRATIVDNLSSNGVLVRGAPASNEMELAPGAPARLGDTRLVRAAASLDSGDTVPPGAPSFVTRARGVAAIDLPLSIWGAPGCGQAALARTVHLGSRRAERPFFVLPCASVPPDVVADQLLGNGRETRGDGAPAAGLLRCAHGGSILFDGVDEMAVDAQNALLRVLLGWVLPSVSDAHRRPFDVRVMVAGRPPSHAPGTAPSFVQRLFEGVPHVVLDAPPLASMTDDVAELAASLLAASGDRRPLGPGVADVLRAFPWPGNLDQLRDAMDFARSVARGERIERNDLPRSVRGPVVGIGRADAVLRRAQREAVERSAIAMARAAAGSNAGAARLLGRSEVELCWDLARLGLPESALAAE